MLGSVNAPGSSTETKNIAVETALTYAVVGNKTYRGEFSTSNDYAKDDVALVNTTIGWRFMVATENITAGAYDASKWTGLEIEGGSGGGGGDTTVPTTMLVYNEGTGEWENKTYSNTANRLALYDSSEDTYIEPSWSGTAPITEVKLQDGSWAVLTA